MKLSEYIKEFGDKQVDVDKLSEFIIEDKVFEPKENEMYYFISSDGAINYSLNNHKADRNKINYQQVYRTEEEAKFARDKAIFLEFMRKEFLRNSDVIDWGDLKQNKFHLTFLHVENYIPIWETYSLQEKGFHTTNKKWLERFIKDYKTEIKMYYFGIKGEQ